ncbi:MAG: FAD:protein FMN transferase [Bacteroidales bacterium]|nr:FAD:protein FMN transferase [Bacteroidales bacterium]
MKRIRLSCQIRTVLLSVLVLGCMTACRQQAFQHHTGEVFHTSYHIQYASAESLLPDITACLDSINASLSMFNPHSTLSRINRAEAGPVDISSDRLACLMIARSLEISRLTAGAFDITVAPLVNLWGFGPQEQRPATDKAIDSLLSFVGYHHISFDTENGLLYKSDRRISLDASAIAKGYACDVVAGLLEKHGIADYLIEIGGEIRMDGHNAQGEVWKVGIDRPMDDPMAARRELQSVLQVTGRGLATSGNYRNFYVQDGSKIAHTIDPRSGYPVENGLLSATVTAPDCLTADALATAFMVMGTEKAVQLTDSLPYIDAYLIYSDGSGQLRTWCSASLRGCLKELE